MKRLKPLALFCSDADDKYCVCVWNHAASAGVSTAV
jgi:hypothetical protein